MKKIAYLLWLLLAVSAKTGFCADGLLREPAAIQVSSTASDGTLSIREIIDIARQNKVRVVILGERDLMKWEYGLWPFRNLFKKTVEDRSLFRYGVERYLAEIRRYQDENPDMVIIPGVESAPYYYWSGNPFGYDMKINDWHRHMLAAGFTRPSEYERIPVIGNRRGLALPVTLVSFIPFGVCILGIALMFVKGPKLLYLSGIVIAGFSVLWIVDKWPHGEQVYDQYKGDLGIAPYRRYVDYAARHGAVTFWSHPQAENVDRSGAVAVETKDYSDMLGRIDGCTGFFIFYEGYTKIGVPGGIWDQVLADYCRGRRKMPLWAAAGLAADSGALDRNLQGLRTVLLVPSLSREEVIKALREGRMYVVSGGNPADFILDEFCLEADGGSATMGEELEEAGNHTLRIRGHLLDGQKQPFRIKLIRDASVIKVFEFDDTSFALSFNAQTLPSGRGYYRAEISTPGLMIITNPVFFSD